MVSVRSRHRKARNYHFAKINDHEAELIRQLAEGGMTQTAIGRKFGLARETVRDICNFRTWRR